MNGIFLSVVLFACVLSFDTMSQVLQDVFKQRAKTVQPPSASIHGSGHGRLVLRVFHLREFGPVYVCERKLVCRFVCRCASVCVFVFVY